MTDRCPECGVAAVACTHHDKQPDGTYRDYAECLGCKHVWAYESPLLMHLAGMLRFYSDTDTEGVRRRRSGTYRQCPDCRRFGCTCSPVSTLPHLS